MSSRSLTTAQRADLEDPTSPNAILGFLTIWHSDLPAPVRIVSDVIDYQIGSDLYTAVPFDVGLFNDDDQMPRLEIVAPNIDRRIGLALERSSIPAVVGLTVYSSADFDLSASPRTVVSGPTALYTFSGFEGQKATVSASAVSLLVGRPDMTNEPWPYIRATQNRMPGLFV